MKKPIKFDQVMLERSQRKDHNIFNQKSNTRSYEEGEKEERGVVTYYEKVPYIYANNWAH